MNNELLNYLIEQRKERAAKLEAYNEAVALLEAAKKNVESFGDVSGYASEIEKLDGFIASILGEETEESAPAEVAEDGGVADGVVVTEEE